MDAFWTGDETMFRRTVRGRLAANAAPVSPAGPLTLAERVAVVEEAACRDPRLGRELAGSGGGSGPADRAVEEVLGYARLAGVATYVLKAGARAARERGSFASSLMGCREVQERLAGLASAAALMGLRTCRLCRLLERGDRDRAGAESEKLLPAARALGDDVRAVALSLLGAPWVAGNLPREDIPEGNERTPR